MFFQHKAALEKVTVIYELTSLQWLLHQQQTDGIHPEQTQLQVRCEDCITGLAEMSFIFLL